MSKLCNLNIRLSIQRCEWMAPPEIFRWILDVQLEWPYPETIKSGRDAAPRWALENGTRHALELLPMHEREKILRFYHIRDAKLSLGSHLLKHCAIVRTCNVPWAESTISRDQMHKPCYRSAGGPDKQMEFNVSHHGSLVALAGCAGGDVQLGVDLVQVDPSKEIPKIRQEGWSSWVNTYASVFSSRELQDIVTWEPSAPLSNQDILTAKLRHFYAHWCLKEAYVKMTGEALMAPWLQEMEFRNVQVPRAGSELSVSGKDDGWGEICSDVQVWRDGVQLTEVKLELQAFRDHYMAATAVSSLSASFLPYHIIDLPLDVYSVAEVS